MGSKQTHQSLTPHDRQPMERYKPRYVEDGPFRILCALDYEDLSWKCFHALDLEACECARKWSL